MAAILRTRAGARSAPAALASAQPNWDHVQGQEGRAMALVGKLNQVLEYQGYEGGLDGLRRFLEEEAEPESSGF